jgi:regulation of enolase protein 1 (concanavalin A-like superfamily)
VAAENQSAIAQVLLLYSPLRSSHHMPVINLLENFEAQPIPQMDWLYPPHIWSLEGGRLTLYPDAQTDYWQRTHYGFQNDNGHFFYTEVKEDFTLTAKARFTPLHQYDQAGLMVRISPDFWLKTSIEFEPEQPNRLGAVVTRCGYSDWSTQDISKKVGEYQLRVQRVSDDYLVEYRQFDRDRWSQIRMTHLENLQGAAIQCGLYACSPKEGGFKAEFEILDLEIST